MRQPVLLAAAIAAFGICASVTACSVRADAPEYRPSEALAHWFESLDRPDFDASVDSVISCCDAGAPGHYDALILTTMHDGAIELMHKNLRRP